MINKILELPKEIKKIPSPMSYLWVIWIIVSIVITDIVMVDEPFALESRVFYKYLICLIPMIIFFSDKDFLKQHHFDTKLLITMIPYFISLVFIITAIILPRVIGIDSGFGLMARESALAFFWVFSIPLTVIYNVKAWCVSAVAVCINSILYLKLLDHVFSLLREITPLYLSLTVGVVIISCIISFIIFKTHVKIICNE